MRKLFSWMRRPVKPPASSAGRALFGALAATVVLGFVDLFVLVALLFGGRYQACGRLPHQGTCDMLALLVLLPAGGIATGAAMGVISPVLRRYWLAIPAVSAALIPLFAALAFTFVDKPPLRPLEFVVLVLGTSTGAGWAIAYTIWLRSRDE